MKHELLNGYNLDLLSQTRVLEKIVMSSKIVKEAIERAVLLDLDNYYIGAGSIAQTVWNYLSNNPLDYGIKDIDFVYYDDGSIDLESENTIEIIKRIFENKVEICKGCKFCELV